MKYKRSRSNKQHCDRRRLHFESLEARLCLSTTPSVDDDGVSASIMMAASGDAPTVELITPRSMRGNTGEKPQSKVWTHDDKWWSVFADGQGTALWRLDGASWTRVASISSTVFRADVKPVGDLVHVLLEKDNNSRLVTLEYVAGGAGMYQFWSQQPTLVSVPLLASTETATLDVDSTGTMWIAYDTTTEIRVIHSQAPYTSWGTPIIVAAGVTSDDISTIIAMPGNKIGVLWSNQTTDRFGFRIHEDGAAPSVWSADEVPASQSALNIGNGMADDHLSVATTSDGTLYAAIKTSYDTGSQPAIGLLVRRPNGQWDPLYGVDNQGTRGIVALSESQNRLLVFYRDTNSSGPIVYRESSLGAIAFGNETVLLTGGNLSNPSSVNDDFGDELIVIAAGDDVLHGAHLQFTAATNQPPQVAAGSDAQILLGGLYNLDGTVSDDGLPEPPTVSTLWSLVSGPASVGFADETAIDTTVTFREPGIYVLRLSASDGELSDDDELTIEVLPPATNQPPQVAAGSDAQIQLGDVYSLDGTVNDDGLPEPPLVSTLWSLVSGPASVGIADETAIDTTVTFSEPGIYVLRLAASDGELSDDDELTIEVLEDIPEPVTVHFQDGVHPSAAYQGTTDTKLRKGSATQNFGLDNTMLVDGAKPSSGLLRWDISTIPVGSQLVEAKITVNVNDASAQVFEIYEVARAWVETEATWNQSSAGVPWEVPGASGSSDRHNVVLGTITSPSIGEVTFTLNVQGLGVIQAWVDSLTVNNGLIIQDYTATDSLAFRTSEGGVAVRPKLTITYVPPSQSQSLRTAAASAASPSDLFFGIDETDGTARNNSPFVVSTRAASAPANTPPTSKLLARSPDTVESEFDNIASLFARKLKSDGPSLTSDPTAIDLVLAAGLENYGEPN